MVYVYDNGELLLGKKIDIIKYMVKLYLEDKIESEDLKEIYDYIKDYEDYDVICVNYDNGMGLSFDVWTKEDKVNID